MKPDSERRMRNKYKAGTMKPRRIGFVRFEHKPPVGAVAVALTKDCVAWVDERDWETVSKYRWYANFRSRGRGCYAESATGSGWRRDGTKAVGARANRIVRMHHVVLGVDSSTEVDHRKHFPHIADNRRSNLRVVEKHQNNVHNTRKTLNPTSSVFKGVSWQSNANKWRAGIHLDDTAIYLGLFENEMQAALAYDEAAVSLFGEYALTNLPVKGSTSWMFDPMPFGLVRHQQEI